MRGMRYQETYGRRLLHGWHRLSKMIERPRKHQLHSVVVAHNEVASLDYRTDAAHAHANLVRRIGHGSIVRRRAGETKLVVVTSGKQALQGDRPAIAREQSLRPLPARQRCQ